MSDLDDLEKKLHAAEHVHDPTPEELERQSDLENKRVGLQIGMEFTASIVFGVFIGLMLDKWLDTQPLLMIICFFIGVFVGFYNIYRVTNNLGSSVGFSELHRTEKDAKTTPEKENE